ncbi:MAG: phospholipid scramblase-related protein [Bacteriovoracia bacterium]
MKDFEMALKEKKLLHVQQVFEGFELLGFETRNKYQILDENKEPFLYAAEQSKGIGVALLRQFLGHWRPFTVQIFDKNKGPLYKLDFPFRWFFKTLYVSDVSGRRIGHLQQRFALFRKKFDVHDVYGQVVAKINSSFFRFWTFEFYHQERKLGTIQKKWSGALGEFFTDKDNFVVSFADQDLSADTKALMLSTCIMVDIIYFENNKGSNSVDFNFGN